MAKPHARVLGHVSILTCTI
ncbi:hypothetical protein F383_04072 [Gossypium arboreum]|uniref:Uncharacterized protein n=1 Tax=Gossypium arboreum TaxID=29729 RepID=A0A0B0MQM8_GOSAR|nr:hypothetical protein F383_10382 [Gossypium arboreum]KHG14564.1 hypothetical protein F383_04072 [Gossypium arboreum]